MMSELLQYAGTYGFGALMAVLIFVAYERLVRQVLAVVEANTRAMEELAAAIQRLQNRVQVLEERIERRSDAELCRSGGHAGRAAAGAASDV